MVSRKSAKFQFYDSPIKRADREMGVDWYKWFQFYDSPIKSREPPKTLPQPPRFNSMIVRLKDLFSIHIDHRWIEFQFYDSPIKSLAVKAPLLVRSGWFQFYDSPIKSNNGRKKEIALYQFQFYDSPIKRQVVFATDEESFEWFQFYDSPIKSFSAVW